MIFIIFTFLIFGGWYVWVKIRGTDMVKVKFDYTTKKTSRISTWKIIGLKTHSYYSYNSGHYNFTNYLIVNYVNPQTGNTEEYTTKESVNASPFYALRSLDVSVYYKDRDHIWVDDFKRIKKLEDNIAFQVTGYVDGKDPGILKYVGD